jgi:hypothetical protein
MCCDALILRLRFVSIDSLLLGGSADYFPRCMAPLQSCYRRPPPVGNVGSTSEIAAIVLFVVPTISFRPLYGLLTMDMGGSTFCGSELLHIQRPNGSPISS